MAAALLFASLLGQALAVQAQDPQLGRIREAVAETPAITMPASTSDDGKPLFRVKVQAWTFKGRPWDKEASIIPYYVRPSMPLAHYEFMEMVLAANRGVTPEEFRAATLYPGVLGVTFDPGTVKKFLTDWRRAVAERQAREDAHRDFEAYLRARAAADR